MGVAKQVLRNFIERSVLAMSGVTAAGIARFVRKNGAYAVFEKHGYHLLKKHYYLPIPDEADLNENYWNFQSELVGIDMNASGALALMNGELSKYVAEFRSHFPLEATTNPEEFYLLNGSFMAVDAHLYYGLIRQFRPKRIVEIGSGNSTLVALVACDENAREYNQRPALTAIEPFPRKPLKDFHHDSLELVREKVQNVDLNVFASLEPGDILFIDSTHALREGGDVWWEYCEILPRLAPGVLVHIHDVSLPKPYPRCYSGESHYYWNEQYLLQAFLTFNSRFKVIWPGNYMLLKHPKEVLAMFPEIVPMRERYTESEPASFWMQVAG